MGVNKDFLMGYGAGKSAGGGSSGGGVLYVNANYSTRVCDKSYNDVASAVEAGKIVAINNGEGYIGYLLKYRGNEREGYQAIFITYEGNIQVYAETASDNLAIDFD